MNKIESDSLNKICIVIPSFNRCEKTLRCLNSLSIIKKEDISISVVVVDASSTDTTREDIKHFYPSTVLIQVDNEHYWTASVNAGIRWALNLNYYDHILVLNDDTIHDEFFLKEMVKVANKKPNCIVGSVIGYMSKPSMIRFAGAAWKFSRLGWYYPQNHKSINSLKNVVFEVESINGNCCLIPVNLFNRIGLYDEVNLPHYYADSEFTIRAKKIGVNLLVSRLSVVWDDDSDINERKNKYNNGIRIYRDIFLDKRSPFYLRGICYFNIKTSPKKLEAVALLIYKITRIALKAFLISLYILRPKR